MGDVFKIEKDQPKVSTLAGRADELHIFRENEECKLLHYLSTCQIEGEVIYRAKGLGFTHGRLRIS